MLKSHVQDMTKLLCVVLNPILYKHRTTYQTSGTVCCDIYQIEWDIVFDADCNELVIVLFQAIPSVICLLLHGLNLNLAQP